MLSFHPEDLEMVGLLCGQKAADKTPLVRHSCSVSRVTSKRGYVLVYQSPPPLTIVPFERSSPKIRHDTLTPSSITFVRGVKQSGTGAFDSILDEDVDHASIPHCMPVASVTEVFALQAFAFHFIANDGDESSVTAEGSINSK